ncbi:MAG TPA: GNAT family N-acetyltransferase [Acidimicrobiales bacterium]|nr:GNAT family N-acetyltransferase [Acidimicrobiales bacterium]
MRPRSIDPADWSAVLEMNEAAVELVSRLDSLSLDWLVKHAHRTIAVEADGQVVAFTLALPAGTAYRSPNYRWFAERYARFSYLDRVVAAESWRRRGVATLVYDEMEASAVVFGRMLCEVDLEPANLPSLGFHFARGYQEVGQLASASGKTLLMLAKEFQTSAAADGRRSIASARRRKI